MNRCSGCDRSVVDGRGAKAEKRQTRSVRPSPYRCPMDMDNPQDVDAAFWAQMLGVTISDERPAPDSPLGRVRAFTERYGEDALRPEHIRAAVEGRPLPPPE